MTFESHSEAAAWGGVVGAEDRAGVARAERRFCDRLIEEVPTVPEEFDEGDDVRRVVEWIVRPLLRLILSQRLADSRLTFASSLFPTATDGVTS